MFDELVLKHHNIDDAGIVLSVNIMVCTLTQIQHTSIHFFLTNAEYDDEALSDTVDHTSYT